MALWSCGLLVLSEIIGGTIYYNSEKLEGGWECVVYFDFSPGSEISF